MRCLAGPSLVLLLTIAGCGQPASDRPNVILVLVDTLRADHVGTYGYSRPTTPFLDRLGDESVVFEQVRSQATCTFPSVNSLLTSRYPFPFNLQGPNEMGIPEQLPSLAEVLQREGYHTVAVSASAIVRATPSKENPSAGFGRGFEVFDEYCRWNNANCVNNRALTLLRDLQEPFFLYLHYLDPHGQYTPPATYQRQFAGPYQGHDFIAAGDYTPIDKMLFGDGPEIEIGEADIQHLVDLYDDEIRYFDGKLEELYRKLQKRGLIDRSLLVITSDHGEEFLEHRMVGHCRGAWTTLSRVPLIMRFPGVDQGRRVAGTVQLVDVVPTILDELGIEAAGLAAEGVSLSSVLRGGQVPRQYAFTVQGRYRAADDGRWQLILDGSQSTATLFDLHADPLANRDLFRQDHSEAERLGTALNRWLDDTGQWVDFDAALAASKAKEEELRALGYLE